MDQNQPDQQTVLAEQKTKARKKYLRAVRRRLALAGLRRSQALKALEKEIPQEAQSVKEITEALGSASDYADRLNLSRKDWVYSKNPWRFLFLALGILGSGALLYDAFLRTWAGIQSSALWRFFSSGSPSVGVIGGADGPTAVFVTGPALWYLIPALLLAVVGFAGYYILRHWKTRANTEEKS